jgi:hypothetical protein
MSKLTKKEKRILSFIITNCELYHLNETEAMTYIGDNFSRPISKRTYYCYKNRIYNDYKKSSIYSELLSRSQPLVFRRYCYPFLAYDKIEMLRNGLKDKIYLEKYDKLTFIPEYLKALQTRAITSIESLEEASIESLEESTYKLESEKRSLDRNLLSIPDNASVREEFIRCGKISCFSCPHGHYYAYWKENGKLKKKYVGIDRSLLTVI